ncbi:MAG: hypothetical protein ABW072_18020 [Sedimenticola sp.]
MLTITITIILDSSGSTLVAGDAALDHLFGGSWFEELRPAAVPDIYRREKITGITSVSQQAFNHAELKMPCWYGMRAFP